MKKIFLIIIFFLLIINVKAECSDYDIIRLKAFANNVNYTYDYYLLNNEAYFNVILSNITSDMYLIDNLNRKYNYYNTMNGEIILSNFKENVTITLYSFSCDSEKLRDIEIKFPIYNKFHNDLVCQNRDNLIWCKKWSNKLYLKEEIVNKNEQYDSNVDSSIIKENKNDFFEKFNYFYTNYYYIFLPIIIIFGLLSIILINKKQKFNLFN